ncbi:MAG: hypothetical protein HKO59_13400 [Phycisphaerales bacterium]|nr:hypothetical protein [Phycisphaerae bacterium]NNF44752.1 hypothetical protein [Phycisphaerales bacterium]NNM26958.1 hypothetical protein [Phycisphaerales bacterium]
MFSINETLQTVQQQLRGLTGTARLLISSLLVILVMALLLVAVYTGRSALVPLGLSTISPEARTQAINYLQVQGIKWREQGGDILVPTEQRHVLLAQLTENELITPDQINFSTVIQDDSPFTGRSARRTRYLVAKMNEVSRMISEMNGIDRATVVIDQPEGPGGIGIARIEPTASVNVTTTGEALSRTQADAVARIVAGSHAPLKVENVTVVDARTNRRVAARTEDALGVSEHLEHKQATERHVKRKIEEMLSYIPGLLVAVNAQVDGSEVVTHRVGVEEPKHGVTAESSRERNATNVPYAGEPGVRANAGDALTVSGLQSTMSETENDTRTIPAFPTSDTSIRQDRGFALKINATIKVPQSWFLAIYRLEQGDPAAEADAATLQPIVDRVTQQIRGDVEPLVETDARQGALPGTVVVSSYSDAAIARDDGGGWAQTGVGSMLVSDGGIKSIGLGALALVSLMFMLMIVRKASHDEEMPTAEELVGLPPALADGELDLVGEADESVAAMEGVEIDEESVRRQQMLEQINDLAVNSSDEAAGLLRKWMKAE